MNYDESGIDSDKVGELFLGNNPSKLKWNSHLPKALFLMF